MLSVAAAAAVIGAVAADGVGGVGFDLKRH